MSFLTQHRVCAWIVMWVGVVAMLCAGSAQAGTPIVSWNGADTNWRTDGATTLGASFTVGGAPIDINHLGVHDKDSDGLVVATEVGLWSSGGTLITNVTVPSGTSGILSNNFRYAALGGTVTLSASTSYVIGAFVGNGREPFLDVAGAFSGSGMTMIQARFDGWPSGSFTYPNTSGGNASAGAVRWCAANALYIPTAGNISWSGLSTGTTASNALAQATLTVDGDSNAVVTLYWDTTDKGAGGAWSYSNAVGTTATGLVQNVLMSNLLASTSYSYRFYGTNTTFGTAAWSDPESFTTDGVPGPPTVANSPAATVDIGTAILSGTITATNGAPLDHVRIYWGDNDGGETHTWDHTNVFTAASIVTNTPFSTNLTGLIYGIQYHYRTYASNSFGQAWAADTTFVTANPLVTQYSFEDNGLDTAAGGSVADNLTPFGTVTYTNGVVGKAVSLNGGEYSAADSVDLDCTNAAWTIEMFIKDSTATVTWRRLGVKWFGTTDWQFALYFDKLDFYDSSSVPRIDQAGPALNDGEWHHLAIANDSSDGTTGLKGWVDGVLVYSGPGITLVNGTDSLILGDTGLHSYSGIMDEFLIHYEAKDQAYINTRVALFRESVSGTIFMFR